MESSPEHISLNRERGLNRLRAVCRRPAFWVFLFLLFLILYCWPFLPTSTDWSGWERYIFLFAVWGFNVLAIAVVAVLLPVFRQGGSRLE